MNPRDQLGAYEIIAPIGAGYTVQGRSFLPDKPRLWSDKRLANLINIKKSVDLGSDGNRIVHEILIPPKKGGTPGLRNR